MMRRAQSGTIRYYVMPLISWVKEEGEVVVGGHCGGWWMFWSDHVNRVGYSGFMRRHPKIRTMMPPSTIYVLYPENPMRYNTLHAKVLAMAQLSLS